MKRPAPDLKPMARQATQALSVDAVSSFLGDPLIIVSAPRSGSTLLFEQHMRTPGLWSIGGESHAIFREFSSLRAENAALDSMSLGAAHATPEIADLFKRLFVLMVRNHQGHRYLELPPAARPPRLQLIEKTPRNALNIPFLLKLFPNARFLYLHRPPRDSVASLIEAWTVGLQRGRFVTFRDLPDWHLPGWCFLLPPGWRSMKGKSIADIAAFQWIESNRAIMAGLGAVKRDRWMSLSYPSFLKAPSVALRNAVQFLGQDTVIPDINASDIPLSRSTVSQPSPEKWRRYEAEIEANRTALDETQTEIDAFCKV